ncbi:corticosteroid binding protein [Scheffersomyces coipomensis]|uniref:corticosteroid binding protein n=1 Tax=Scheffersomyces coipomensis TaxID=1788519 RepID=UPI00315DC56C
MVHKKVIIIGGGISGVKATLDLYNGGVQDTLILEARDRLGGRLLSIDSTNNQSGGDVKYDLGASWFHDSLNNPLFDKALAKGNVSYYYDDGKSIFFSPEDKYIEHWKYDAVMEEILTYISLTYQNDPFKPDISLKEICNEYVSLYKSRLTNDQIKYGVSVVRMWAELWHGEDWEKLSAKYTFDGLDHQGRNVFVKNGYRTVFNNELLELPESYRNNNIKLNTQVSSINYTNKKLITIITSDKQEFTCDYLIVTIPQSLLLINDPKDQQYIDWKPILPPHISDILPSVHYGSLGKVVFEFDTIFWPKDVDRFYALTDHQPNHGSNYKPWDFPSIFVNYAAMAQTPSLVALIQAPLAAYIENLDTDPTTKSQIIWDLFKPLIESFSIISNIPAPTNIYHTPWTNDKYARGAYGTVKIGSGDPERVTAAFIEGIENRIKFAGAETIDGSANGCAHGGWFSGQREAKFILDRISSEKLNAKL